MTIGCVSAFSRRDPPELCKFVRPTGRGRRECRVLAAPAVSCAISAKKCAHEHTGTAEALRHSLRNGFTAYAELSLETNSFCLHRCRLDGAPIRLDHVRHRQLGTSHGCQDHTVLPYASAPYVLRAVSAHGRRVALRTTSRADAAASTASRPTFVTMANAPLVGTGRRKL
jgi:hypothetical protein